MVIFDKSILVHIALLLLAVQQIRRAESGVTDDDKNKRLYCCGRGGRSCPDRDDGWEHYFQARGVKGGWGKAGSR